jgi:hypothetical protein
MVILKSLPSEVWTESVADAPRRPVATDRYLVWSAWLYAIDGRTSLVEDEGR